MMGFVKQRRCQECATVVRGQATLCPVCGCVLAAQRHTEHCPACGARLEAGGRICPICGARRAPARRRPSARVLLVAGLLALSAGTTIAVVNWQLRPWLERTGTPAQAVRASWQTLCSRAQALVSEPTPTLRATARPTASSTPAAKAAATRTLTATPTPTTPALPTPTPEPTVTLAPVVYAIAKGDVLERIAARYDVSPEALAQANGITGETILSIGRELVIPITPTAAPTVAAAIAATREPTGAPASATVAPTASRASPTHTAAPPTSAPVAPTPRVHVIAKGEHLGTLSLDYGVSQQDIADANGITLNSILSIGQELIIPQPGQVSAPAPQPVSVATAAANRTPLPTATIAPTPAVARHIVAKGDTFGALALRYGVATEAIAQANGLGLKSVLSIGQELMIPGVSPTPPAAPSAAAPVTATATMMATARPTALPTLTRMPTPIYNYREPRLLWPILGSVITGTEALPVLSWTSVGILDEDVWYRVRIWTPASDEGPTDIYTKATSHRLTKRAQPQGRRLHTVRWQVQVVEHRGGGSLDLPLSLPSPEYNFTWR